MSFTSEMQRLASQNKRLYTEFLNNQDNINLMKMFENEDETLRKMDENITKQKVPPALPLLLQNEISKEISFLLERVTAKIKQLN